MQLPDLKELAKFIDLCRRKGVSSIAIGELKMDLRPEAPESPYKRKKQTLEPHTDDESNPYRNFPDGILSNEQLLFYSAGGAPEDDPTL